ncbi:hypothetical protein GBAR_LOCUS1431 [Geodia barretti]|uniref:Uncharacterized protein n=1 Tax=Geodia barretti TaxID=519541 RepID=A0AA35QWQ2_GEOBA|nr:hypothetical protein GBAR_LOCUS1431 [Geodia barretti]
MEEEAEGTSKVGGRKFLEDSDEEEEEEDEANTTGELATDNAEPEKTRTESTSQEDVFGASEDEVRTCITHSVSERSVLEKCCVCVPEGRREQRKETKERLRRWRGGRE